MRSKIQKRAIAIVLISLAGLYIVLMPHDRLPNAADLTSWTQFKKNLQKNIHLGLDLKGGSHLVMQVKVNEAIKKNYTDKNVEIARNDMQQNNWQFNEIKATDTGQITITLPNREHVSDIIAKLTGDFNSTMPDAQGWKASDVGNSIVYNLDQTEANAIRERDTNQALQIIESRINAFGVTEPTIQREGGAGQYLILVEMPGIDNTDRVKETLNADQNLDIKPVAKGPQATYPTKDAAEAAAKALPGGADNYEVLPYVERSDSSGSEGFMIVGKDDVVSGLDMRDADAMSSQYGGDNYQINFSLTKTGAQKFGAWTGAHVGDQMAIILNDRIVSAPKIESQIHDKGEITGGFTKDSAEKLAFVLRSGALPAKVEYLEEITVGPSLGADSIKAGVEASVAGLLAVMIFMLWYYRLSGVNAVLALLLNLILLLAALVVFGATLTLPGIAGVILTIGMAVDSNVLIFERIREEMRNGKTVASSVDLGFGKAFLTIIDTHVTTIVSAVFLFVFGTGPIRGFAVTLVAGLLANLFTAVFVSRTIFMWHLNRSARVETLSI